MKITCTIKDAMYALGCVAVASTTNSLPILSGVLFQAEEGDDHVSLSTGNLICAMTTSLPGIVEESGTCVTPVEPLVCSLQSLVQRYAPTERMTFSDDGSTCGMTVMSSGESLPLERLRSEDFLHTIPESNVQALCTVSSRAYKDAIKQVLFAAASDEQEGQFSCVWGQVDLSGLLTVATSDRWHIAVRTLSVHATHDGFFLIPLTAIMTLLHCFPKEEPITILLDPQRNALHLRSQTIQVIARLQEVTWTTIPFLRYLPTTFRRILLLPTAKLKALLRKQDLLHCSLIDGQQGAWNLQINRYGNQGALRGQKKGETLEITVSLWGPPCQDFWLASWSLAEIVSTPATSPVLVLAMDESTVPKMLVRWCDAGEVRQDTTYAVVAQDPYLAKLSTMLSLPLSETAMQVLEQLQHGHNKWSDRTVRQPVLARILLLIEQQMQPTKEDICRIVRDPNKLSERYDQITQIREKREKERRFERLLTDIAIQSFADGGATLTIHFSETLHVLAADVERLLEVRKEYNRLQEVLIEQTALTSDASLLHAFQMALEALEMPNPFQAFQDHLQGDLKDSEAWNFLQRLLPAVAMLDGYAAVHLEGCAPFYARVEGRWNQQTGWREAMITHPVSGHSVRIRKHATTPEYYEVRGEESERAHALHGKRMTC